MHLSIYIGKDCPYSHIIRIVLEEKLMIYKCIELDLYKDKDYILTLNPEGHLPILKDRDFIIYNTNIIMTYLEERYPVPSLLPSYPLEKAKIRLEIIKISNNYFSLLLDVINHDNKYSKLELIKIIESIKFKFLKTKFFMLENISFADCYFMALFYSLFKIGLKLDVTFKDISKYIKLILSRKSFIKTIPKKYHNIII